MTVKELIIDLLEYPMNMKIRVRDSEEVYCFPNFQLYQAEKYDEKRYGLKENEKFLTL